MLNNAEEYEDGKGLKMKETRGCMPVPLVT